MRVDEETRLLKARGHSEAEIEEFKDMKYVDRIPRKLPRGRVLVHNSVEPASSVGDRGSRAWTQKMTDRLELCDCNWAGVDLHGLKHYRVKQSILEAAGHKFEK